MKRVNITRLASIVAVVTGLVSVPMTGVVSAAAAELNILVVNERAIFQSSLAGKDESRKLQVIFKAIQDDEAKELEPLKQEAMQLQQQRAILGDSFAQKQMELQRKGEYTRFKYEQERKATQEVAQRLIQQRVYPIYNEIMKERKGTMLIDQSQVLMSSPDFNITDEVIKRLDATMPTVDLQRITFAQLAKAAEEQRKAMEAAQK